MPIELRILSGARAGQTESFDKAVIVVGRHPASDLRFDVKQDLDVSTKHGEIRSGDAGYSIHDFQSTNGTFVNGQRVRSGGSRVLSPGDTVAFGASGPQVTVHFTAPAGAAKASGPPRRGTGERIAIAVRQQTLRLRIAIVGAVVVLGGVAAGFYLKDKRDVTQLKNELKGALAAIDAQTQQFAQKFTDDTALTNALKQRNDSLSAAVERARASGASGAAQEAIRAASATQRTVTELDAPAIVEANNNSVVLINAEIGKPQEATGFCISAGGLILTNRHVVQDDATGAKATRIHVKFANSREWKPAHVVRIGDGKNIDIALIQVDVPGTYRFAAVAPTVDVPVGSAIATIGFPDGTSIPMDGEGNDAAAKTTLTLGTTSKSLSDLLQLDSYASHGSSGSPVFDKHRHVIGIVWGGINNRIVYAVPAERITELVKGLK